MNCYPKVKGFLFGLVGGSATWFLLDSMRPYTAIEWIFAVLVGIFISLGLLFAFQGKPCNEEDDDGPHAS